VTKPLSIRNITAHYGQTKVLEDLSLDIAEGELVSLLGASGCGKTTTLRLVAGFLQPTSGSITLGGKDLTKLPAHQRDIGLVFQNYALFPHLTVADNVGFGLKQRGVSGEAKTKRVGAMLERVGRVARSSAWRSPAPSSSSRRC
jgi:putative spermidine/putrescine transport system ATP-binding protein